MHVAIVAGPNPARAFPAAALASRLRNNGDGVLMLTGRRWVDSLRLCGVTAEEMPGVTGESGSAEELRYRSPAHSAAMTPAIRARLAEWRPDLVVADVRTPAGGFAAELLHLPWAQLHPHPLSFSDTRARSGGHDRHSRTGLFRSREPSPRDTRRTQRELAAARESLELSPDGWGPSLHMVATLPGLEPPRQDWPRNASVVGPLMWDPAVDDLPIPAGQSPLVMVSPSTSATTRPDLLNAALTGLQGVRLVGTVLQPYAQPVPSWASVGPGRQEPLLSQAAVVVTGGGHGMIVRALTAGVPVVLAPTEAELELARRAERLGAAVVLRRADSRGLRRAVERVIEDRTYASAARQIARTAATADPVVLCHQMLLGRSVA